MRYILVLLPFAVAGCAYSYPVGYGYNYPVQAPQYAAGYGYYGAPVASAPAYESEYSAAQANATENCGTPFELRACPPMPRRPLAYYPANRP